MENATTTTRLSALLDDNARIYGVCNAPIQWAFRAVEWSFKLDCAFAVRSIFHFSSIFPLSYFAKEYNEAKSERGIIIMISMFMGMNEARIKINDKNKTIAKTAKTTTENVVSA